MGSYLHAASAAGWSAPSSPFKEPSKDECREVDRGRTVNQPLRKRLANSGRVLKAMTGTRRCEQDAGILRMPINDELMIGRDGIKTSALLTTAELRGSRPFTQSSNMRCDSSGVTSARKSSGSQLHFVLLCCDLEPSVRAVNGGKPVEHVTTT